MYVFIEVTWYANECCIEPKPFSIYGITRLRNSDLQGTHCVRAEKHQCLEYQTRRPKQAPRPLLLRGHDGGYPLLLSAVTSTPNRLLYMLTLPVYPNSLVPLNLISCHPLSLFICITLFRVLFIFPFRLSFDFPDPAHQLTFLLYIHLQNTHTLLSRWLIIIWTDQIVHNI